jgi:hypothetical protein
LFDDAQADTVEKFGPRKPYLIEIWPGAISAIILGIKKGLKRGCTITFSKSNVTSSKKVFKPPMPEPHITPIRLVQFTQNPSPHLSPLLLSNKGRIEQTDPVSGHLYGPKKRPRQILYSQANLVLKCVVSKLLIKAAPLTPLD